MKQGQAGSQKDAFFGMDLVAGPENTLAHGGHDDHGGMGQNVVRIDVNPGRRGGWVVVQGQDFVRMVVFVVGWLVGLVVVGCVVVARTGRIAVDTKAHGA